MASVIVVPPITSDSALADSWRTDLNVHVTDDMELPQH